MPGEPAGVCNDGSSSSDNEEQPQANGHPRHDGAQGLADPSQPANSVLDSDGVRFYQRFARDLTAAERDRLVLCGVVLHEHRRYTPQEDSRIRRNWARFARLNALPLEAASTYVCHGTSLAAPDQRTEAARLARDKLLVAALCRKLPHRTGASTQHFSQKDIDQFREAFYLYAQKGTLDGSSHLRYIMRCLGYSPTVQETQRYFREKRGKVDFACFLEVLYQHSQKDDPIKEIIQAFRAHDRSHRGVIPAKELRAILLGMGERMSAQEVDRVFKEAHITDPKMMVRYEDFVRTIAAPLPDY